MINYFRDLLKTLKSIDARLEHLERCIKKNQRRHGADEYVVTGHWND